VDGGVKPSASQHTRTLSSLLLAGLAVVVLVAATTVYRSLVGERAGGAPEPGQVAPTLTLPAVGGEIVALERLRGQQVLLNFRTTTCSYCREETPSLQEASRTVRGLKVLSVYVSEPAGRVEAYTEALGVTYTNLVDADGTAMRAYGIRGVPTSYFLDAEGRVIARHLGPLTMELIRGYTGGAEGG